MGGLFDSPSPPAPVVIQSSTPSSVASSGTLTPEERQAALAQIDIPNGPYVTGSSSSPIPDWAKSPVQQSLSALGSFWNQKGTATPFQWANFDESGGVAKTQAGLQQAPQLYQQWAMGELLPQFQGLLGTLARRGVTGGTPVAVGGANLARGIGQDVLQARATLAPQTAASAISAENAYKDYATARSTEYLQTLNQLATIANAMREPTTVQEDPLAQARLLAQILAG